ncbi:MAG: hypothetical protein WD489_04180 [Rhodovibrionaceae bacterium]
MQNRLTAAAAFTFVLLSGSTPLTLSPESAYAACLGPYNRVPDPVSCAPLAGGDYDVLKLLLPGSLRADGSDSSTLLGWVTQEVLKDSAIPLPFTGIELESTVKESSVDVAAAVIAEVGPGVSVSAHVTYFGDATVEDVQGSVGLGITF